MLGKKSMRLACVGVTVQVGDGDTVGNFLKEVSHTLQELSKYVYIHVRYAV